MAEAGSDTWTDIQTHKLKHESLKERLQKRRKERQVLGLTEVDGSATPPSESSQGVSSPCDEPHTPPSSKKDSSIAKTDPRLEKTLLECLNDTILSMPIDSPGLIRVLTTKDDTLEASQASVESLLQKFAAQNLISFKMDTTKSGEPCMVITDAEHTKLEAVVKEMRKNSASHQGSSSSKRKADSLDAKEDSSSKQGPSKVSKQSKTEPAIDDLESLLSMPTATEIETSAVGKEILELLNTPTAGEQSLVKKFRSQGGGVHQFCDFGTRVECHKNKTTSEPCKKVHFRKIIQKHTDESLGDCSFLNTCFHMDTCKYVHYEVDQNDVKLFNAEKDRIKEEQKKNNEKGDPSRGGPDKNIVLYPPQWIRCDVRAIDMSILGKFSVVMADPPWDIHMELPYGTMSDDEMRRLDVPTLQDEGYIFLWVTGRAMELGRECLQLWGYRSCDELIWVKTNQLQRLIRTGRTGHWLNHGKEHCLVGVKGNPLKYNRGLDCDVLVAEVRETSHKPDEIYGLIERLSPGTRKIELFGRQHNVQPNWVTLGNQLDGVRLLEPEVVARFREKYPEGNCMGPKK